ncbi:alkaline phosphatase family protein [Sphingopyxis sp. 113P3]|uniref:alkaline phosphatase family protein n=1 Tax=Sphingopyxis sp. (strain 113P3) TaxID=292913 RepID=UPI0006AD1738|nr:alkaline phosphatase family protein [Sphingopyxis sp. 113P3]ALC12113.1 LPS-assembly lipoprotein [Sphingopyxis sp. 113P3]
MATQPKFFQLELNEINFDFIRRYCERGKLPTLNKLISSHGITETVSESRYEHLEPWIQWVTAHTGLPFEEHGVFRLGDIVNRDLNQVWEWLEGEGLRVAAVSPMNASNKTREAAFFIPDPWTETEVTGSWLLERVASAAGEAVNENAGAKLGAGTVFSLILAVARYCGPRVQARLASYALNALRGRKWALALVLDELLTAITLSETKATRPDYVTLFLNGGAHIQHHYMFNAEVYEGPHRNPDWLLSPQDDPLLAVYSQYDRFVAQILKALPDYRLVIATGLHQNPYPEECYYWRLADHGKFLSRIGCENFTVQPRMSRDFLVEAGSADNAVVIQRRLEMAVGDDGLRLFDVDNRGDSLFVMLTYPKDIPIGFGFAVGNEHFPDLRRMVNFVAIKNGEHDGIGYLIDTAETADSANGRRVLLSTLPDLVADHFRLQWPRTKATISAIA